MSQCGSRQVLLTFLFREVDYWCIMEIKYSIKCGVGVGVRGGKISYDEFVLNKVFYIGVEFSIAESARLLKVKLALRWLLNLNWESTF